MSTRQIGEILAENLSLALAKTKLTRTDVANRAGISELDSQPSKTTTPPFEPPSSGTLQQYSALNQSGSTVSTSLNSLQLINFFTLLFLNMNIPV